MCAVDRIRVDVVVVAAVVVVVALLVVTSHIVFCWGPGPQLSFCGGVGWFAQSFSCPTRLQG